MLGRPSVTDPHGKQERQAGLPLDSGPEGMTLSENGLLEWTPAAPPDSGKVGVVISISDSGQSKFHSIALAVSAREEARAAGDQQPAAAAASAGGLLKPSVYLPPPTTARARRRGGRYLVLRLDSLQKLAIVDLFEVKIIGYVSFDGKCLFAAGADKLVVAYPEKRVNSTDSI